MHTPLQHVQQEIDRWDPRLVHRFHPTADDTLTNLEKQLSTPLPESYRQLLHTMDGASLPSGRLYSVREAVAEWTIFHTQIAPLYKDDPDWPGHKNAPTHLLPIGQGEDGQLRLLDLSTANTEVVLWRPLSQDFVTTHSSIEAWLMTELNQLGLHYDHSGRPRPIRGRQGANIPKRSLEIHVDADPQSAYAKLQLAHWHAAHSPPEETLFAYRDATEANPPWGLTHYYRARWAVLTNRADEARQSLRRALAIPVDPNPLKNSFRFGYRPAAHMCLAHLYERAGQARKAQEEFRAADKASKRYGFGDYEETDEYRQLLQATQSIRLSV